MTPEQRLTDAGAAKVAAFDRYRAAYDKRDRAYYEWQATCRERDAAFSECQTAQKEWMEAKGAFAEKS